MDDATQKSWDNFLDPTVLRKQLIAASVYLAVFELLKDVLVDRIGAFFANQYDESGWVASPEYKDEVLSRNKSALYASLDWLRNMEAISEQDIEVFGKINALRNRIAHNLFEVLASVGLPPEVEDCYIEMRHLIRKVELWWILNVEVDINPDLVDKEVAAETVASGTEIGVALLGDIAFGDGQISESVYEHFRKAFVDT